MRILKVPPGLIVNSLIPLTKAGVVAKTSDLETHYLAGGDLENISKGLIRAKVQNQPLNF